MSVIYDPILGKLRSGKSTELTLTDTNNVGWILSADTNGVLVTTRASGETASGLEGQSIGLLLAYTYAI